MPRRWTTGVTRSFPRKSFLKYRFRFSTVMARLRSGAFSGRLAARLPSSGLADVRPGPSGFSRADGSEGSAFPCGHDEPRSVAVSRKSKKGQFGPAEDDAVQLQLLPPLAAVSRLQGSPGQSPLSLSRPKPGPAPGNLNSAWPKGQEAKSDTLQPPKFERRPIVGGAGCLLRFDQDAKDWDHLTFAVRSQVDKRLSHSESVRLD